jgi:hypothetical protein
METTNTALHLNLNNVTANTIKRATKKKFQTRHLFKDLILAKKMSSK